MTDPIYVGPPPAAKPEDDFSDFMPTASQIEAAVTMYNGGYTVTQIRSHFASIGCTPIVVDGLTTRVLDLALASLIRSRATEVKITDRLRELGLEPHQITQFLPHILAGQQQEERRHARNGDGWFFMGFFATLAAIFASCFVGGGTIRSFRPLDPGRSLAEQNKRRSKRR